VATSSRAATRVHTIRRHMPHESDESLMARLAVVRLRRFGRVAAVAEQSGSRLWQLLARQAAKAAFRDCLLLSLPDQERPEPIARHASVA
jgi:transposase